MIFLTYNDPPSGIYSGQVTDVCGFLNNRCGASIRLVSLISLRNFFSNRATIKRDFPRSLVLPMFPGPENWKLNYYLLVVVFLFLGKQSVIARGPFAANLALRLRSAGRAGKVCFDARGAYDAEFREYDVAGNVRLNTEIAHLERKALLEADARIAVSGALVSYWKEKYSYNGSHHVIVPCTLNSHKLYDVNASAKRSALGFAVDDVVLVYSGSSAGWQSFGLLDKFLCSALNAFGKIKVLLLIPSIPTGMRALKDFQGRIVCRWLPEEEVYGVLSCCDHGLLIRESSVTNKVASPVKFAEYLRAGLNVVISEGIGDLSSFVREQGCGSVVPAADETPSLSRLTAEDRTRNVTLSEMYFSKKAFISEYKKILDTLS